VAQGVLGGVLATAVAAIGCQRARPSTRPVTDLRTAYTSAVDIGDLPSLLAGRLLERDGYRVTPTFFADPELAVAALASGDVDVASGGTGAFWAAAAKGADLVMIMAHSENGYELMAGPGIERCGDLDGRTLALSSPGSLPTALGEAYLRRCPTAEPHVLVMPHSGDRLAALAHGAVDAAVLQRADVSRLQQQAPGRFRRLEGFGAAVPRLDLEGVFVRRNFLESERLTVVDYLRERILANRQVLDHPALLVEEARRWPAMAPLDEAVVDEEVRAPAWPRDGGLTRERAAATFAFFVQGGILPRSLTVDRLVDVSPLEEALHALAGEDGSSEPEARGPR
jgi:ABC-type nitrate/sulfonate/bicarbonate transport system substrate-binding protein